MHLLNQLDVLFFLLVQEGGDNVADLLFILDGAKRLEKIEVVDDEAQLGF